MERTNFRLINDRVRQLAMQAVKSAPEGFMVEVKPRTRSLDQNALLHSLFSEVAKQSLFFGRKLDSTQWKTIFISAHAVATGQHADVVPGLEGEFVNIRESSASMTVGRMNSLVEYVLAWCAVHHIATKDES